jgi:transcriptional regulator with XRE-family HTH domain
MNEFQLYMVVGQRIKKMREEKGLTQQGLADLCNFEKSNMSRIEAGRTNLTLKSLLAISEALNIQIKQLVDFD